MPATKKSVKKSPAVKRTVAKKAPARHSTSVRTKKAKASGEWELSSGGNYVSFKLAKAPNFFSTKITDQTIYWSILGFLVLAIGIWVVTINDKVQYLYDQIDAQNADNSLIMPLKKTN